MTQKTIAEAWSIVASRVRMGIAGLGRLGQFHAENMAGRAPTGPWL